MTHRPLVLLVDDDDLVRSTLVRMLQPEFDVLDVPCFEDAVDALQRVTTIDAVVTDFDLSATRSGLDVLEEAKRRNTDARRVLVSGSVTPEFSASLVVRGLAHCVMQKPGSGLARALRGLLLGKTVAQSEHRPV